jgi:hypothetical protein
MGIGGMGKLENEKAGAPSPGEVQPLGTGPVKKEDWIGRQLRRVFDDAVSEPLPDDILSLLERLDEPGAPAKPKRESGA